MSQVKIRDQMSIKTSCSDWLTRREYKSRASNEIYRVTKSIFDMYLLTDVRRIFQCSFFLYVHNDIMYFIELDNDGMEQSLINLRS